MNAEEKVQALLIADSALLALVPASKIKVEGDWQGLTAPYIIHGPVGVEPTETHAGQTALRIWPFYQLSVYAISVSAARAIVNAAVTALNGHHDSDVDRIAFKRAIPFGFDTDLKLAHIAVDFEIAGALT